MKKFATFALVFVVVSLMAGVALAAVAAAKIEVVPDGRGNAVPLQLESPSHKKDVALTGNTQTIEVTGDVYWRLFTTGATKFRTLSSATRPAGAVAHTVPTSTIYSEAVNHGVTSKVYLNVSGAGTLRRR